MVAEPNEVDEVTAPFSGTSAEQVQIEPGPYLWRTLRAHAAGEAAVYGKESLLYTDSHPKSTPDRFDIGALTVQSAVGSLGDSGVPAPRIVLRVWEYDLSDAPLRPGYPIVVGAAQDYWLGMRVDEEVAAMLSLLLGVRMRSGGTIRRYTPDDLVGRTDFFEHMIPALPPRAWGGRPPTVRFPVGGEDLDSLDAVLPRVSDLRLLSALDAVTIVRAASVFSDALWVCEHDPELAWLHCVTALELAADRHNRAQTNAIELLRKENRKVFTQATVEGQHALERAAEEHRRRNKAEKKLLALLDDFPPTAPAARPDGLPWTRINWNDPDDLRVRVQTIYAHRSARLHGGVQFPAPLLHPPLVAGAEHAGGAGEASPVWHSSGTGWRNEDLPLTLDAFLHLTRCCLLAWWASLSAIQESSAEA